MRNALLITAVTAMLTLAGCITPPIAEGEPFKAFAKPEPGMTALYVYRPVKNNGGGLTYNVTLGDISMGGLRHGGYLFKQVPPGAYEVAGTTEVRRGIPLRLKPDEVRCVRSETYMGWAMARPGFKEVSLEQCAQEIKATNLSI